jgi:hypothetical protein
MFMQWMRPGGRRNRSEEEPLLLMLGNSPSIHRRCGTNHRSEGEALQIVKTQFLQLSECYSFHVTAMAGAIDPQLVLLKIATC